jgi:nucleoid DNA-binding protein
MPKYDKSQYSLPEVYKFYKRRCKERDVVPVDYKLHKRILDAWGSKVVEYLAAGKDVKLHSGLATLQIRKRKCSSYVDFKASKEAGKAVRKSNVHSGFFSAKVRWTRHYTKIHSRGWKFEPSRTLVKAIVKVMRTPRGHMQYVQKAKVTRHEEHRRSMYTKQILDL